MEMNEYQQLALRTASGQTKTDDSSMLITAALGLCGETGEIADHVKKFLYHGHQLDGVYLRKELGDVLWYVALLAHTIETGLDEVATVNIEKLRKRYPEGFTVERSLNRHD